MKRKRKPIDVQSPKSLQEAWLLIGGRVIYGTGIVKGMCRHES